MSPFACLIRLMHESVQENGIALTSACPASEYQFFVGYLLCRSQCNWPRGKVDGTATFGECSFITDEPRQSSRNFFDITHEHFKHHSSIIPSIL